MGGDIEVFFGGWVKFWEEKSKVQSPESRVQGPVQLLGYAVRLFSQKAVGTSVTHSPNGSCATFLFCIL